MRYKLKWGMASVLTCILVVLVGATPARAAGAPHYSIGVGGSGCGGIPPKGFYYKMYNCFYFSDTYKDGGRSLPGKTETTLVFQVHRVLQNTGIKFLGADFGWQAVLPFIYGKVSADLAGSHGDKHRFGVGDLQIEPMLQWYPHERLSTILSVAFFLPVGDYRKDRAVNPGSGSWGAMVTTGFNFYFDEEKSWVLSPIIYYEKSTKEFSTSKRAGDYVHFEASLQKRVGRWAGAVNFGGTWQVTDSRGFGRDEDKKHQRILQLGPELTFNPTETTELQLKAVFEFKNRNATQGTGVHFTFLKVF